MVSNVSPMKCRNIRQTSKNNFTTAFRGNTHMVSFKWLTKLWFLGVLCVRACVRAIKWQYIVNKLNIAEESLLYTAAVQ